MYANFSIFLQTKTQLIDACQNAINYECVKKFCCLYL